MNENCSREKMVNLVVQLEAILVELDKSDARLVAIKVDEAISSLCEAYDIGRTGCNVLGIKSG
ncbi:MAG: hypothetical protein AAGM33_00155 [Pseudomonadota bacterium]